MSTNALNRRKLPKLMACMTKNSLENLRNRALFNMVALDARGIRRRKLPLYECLILELKESGFTESAAYLQDLIYDNIQLLAEDDIGIVVDLRKREDYLEHISDGLQKAEKHRDRDDTKKECLELLALALYYSEKGKGILWLAEKLFLASIAVASRYLIDGGRQKGCCKYHYAKFLLDKFPGADPEEPFQILTEVRDCAIGKVWPLYEPKDENDIVPPDTLFGATSIQLHKVLLSKSRAIRKEDPGKAERLARLAERRARDANETAKTAEAIIEIGVCQLAMNNLNNAQKTFEKAYKIFSDSNNLEGICETKMHLAAVLQRLGDHESAAKLLTEMGDIAMRHGFRRQLGRALHLLGELHLRREKPELGTLHLAEAFSCFMGYMGTEDGILPTVVEDNGAGEMEQIYKNKVQEVHIEEAELSRLMMAVSAGQELMASYFKLLRDADMCTVSQVKIIEWKLNKSGWWIKKQQHDLVPCMCPVHQRTPLDVLRIQLELLAVKEELSGIMSEGVLERTETTQDIRKLRSSYKQ